MKNTHFSVKENNDSRQTTSRVVLVASRRVVTTAHVPIYFDKHEESMCNFPKVRIINMLISETQFLREKFRVPASRISMYDNRRVLRDNNTS